MNKDHSIHLSERLAIQGILLTNSCFHPKEQ
jgi:hypothetical protein